MEAQWNFSWNQTKIMYQQHRLHQLEMLRSLGWNKPRGRHHQDAWPITRAWLPGSEFTCADQKQRFPN
jgi:hypothetical protein